MRRPEEESISQISVVVVSSEDAHDGIAGLRTR